MNLSDGPVVLANVGVLFEAASAMLHDIERNDVAEDTWNRLMRIQSLLCIGMSTCEMTVEAIEAGPDYRMDGGAA
ncbi:hypothetical protein [Mesorhizobium amorphae]|uniref:hypothetical protein n=1 Tax=Mesorhizobium amorphae TaxID=71433 RepID=UPI001182D302|nr:hypothetical protein [Mesorhizobium amorphae]